MIRRAVEADAKTVAEIHVEGWRWAYRGQVPDAFLEGLSVDLREAAWRGVLASPETASRVWLMERGGKALGFSNAGLPQDEGHARATAELQSIYLLREAAGTGVGRALLAHAVEDLRQRGFTYAYLWVLASNARARRFYEMAGWCADGAIKSDPREGFELREVRYVVKLSARP